MCQVNKCAFRRSLSILKQNEESKKKNKQAALKAQMDREEARKVASEQENSSLLQDEEGQSHTFTSQKVPHFNPV